jgi:hypothetical protein
VVDWATLGDLRRALRLAFARPEVLAGRLPTISGPHVGRVISRARALMRDVRIATARRPEDRSVGARTPSSLDGVAVALEGYLAAIEAEQRDGLRALAELDAARRDFARGLLTGAHLPACARSTRGKPPAGPLLFVHAATYIVGADPDDRARIVAPIETTLTPMLLASINALEPEHALKRPGLLGGQRSKELALKYWRSELAQYRRPLKAPITAQEHHE